MPGLLDPADHLAVGVARDGDPKPVHSEETDTNFAIEWTGNYHIEGKLFVYTDRSSTRVVSVFGYQQPGSPHSVNSEMSNLFGWELPDYLAAVEYSAAYSRSSGDGRQSGGITCRQIICSLR
jgi:hypothetical protein